MDYTGCQPTNQEIINAGFESCDEYIKCKRDCRPSSNPKCDGFLNSTGVPQVNATEFCRNLSLCDCKVNITLTQPLRAFVHVYYGINNFYQNHRRYLNSIDLQQLRGGFTRDPSADCRPESVRTDNGVPYLPCGLIGNSWFNGELSEIVCTRVCFPGTMEACDASLDGFLSFY